MELQQFFIKIRDELCKNGEILLSTSLNYTLKHLHSDVEQEKREKIPKEIEEDKQKKEEEENKGVFELLTQYTSVLKCQCGNNLRSFYISHLKRGRKMRTRQERHGSRSRRQSVCTVRTAALKTAPTTWANLST